MPGVPELTGVEFGEDEFGSFEGMEAVLPGEAACDPATAELDPVFVEGPLLDFVQAENAKSTGRESGKRTAKLLDRARMVSTIFFE